MKKTLQTLLLGVAAIAAGMGAAAAADFEAFPPMVYQNVPEMVPVEIGTGWYLRGDVSYQFDSDVDVGFADDDGEYDALRLEEAFGIGAGVGYRFTDFLRGDVTATYSTPKLEESVYFDDYEVDAELESWEVMANAYLDLGTYVGFTPYVGAGVGAVHASYEASCFFDGQTCSDAFDGSLSGASDWRFAYSLMAGVSYDVSRSLKLDVGYKYLDVEGGEIADVDGLGDLNGVYDDDGFNRHTVQAGVRYSLW